jgi:hypothetical protein
VWVSKLLRCGEVAASWLAEICQDDYELSRSVGRCILRVGKEVGLEKVWACVSEYLAVSDKYQD